MFLPKLVIWSLVYPFTLISFLAITLFDVICFLFHSPVDIWMLIDKALKQQEVE